MVIIIPVEAPLTVYYTDMFTAGAGLNKKNVFKKCHHVFIGSQFSENHIFNQFK